MYPDHRGVFTEVFRSEWDTGVEPVQWNVVSSNAGVLRGVHVHIKHNDYLILVRGRSMIGLRDLRKNSPTEGLSAVVSMDASNLSSLTIPHGVAHGFYFFEASTHIYAVTENFNLSDELGCYWADPELGIDWPVSDVTVSERDTNAQSLWDLSIQLAPFQPI